MALADRLTAPLESAIRLTLLEALSAAAEEITRELAAASVDVRLRGQDPDFVLTADVADVPEPSVAATAEYGDDGGTWRVTLRLPESLRAGVDGAARSDGLSVNAWLVRAVAAALGAIPGVRPSSASEKHFSGWVR